MSDWHIDDLWRRIVVFAVRVLKDERIVVVAEQRPECTEEQVCLHLLKAQIPLRQLWDKDHDKVMHIVIENF